MARIIPRDLIRHLEWTPGAAAPPSPPSIKPPKAPSIVVTTPFDLEQLIHGKPFYNTDLPKALEAAQKYIGTAGTIASMPQLVQAKIIADKENYLWKDWYTALSEENVGIDTDGKLGEPGKAYVIAVHGAGIFSNPERIRQAYTAELINGAGKLSPEEFQNLLEGKMPDGEVVALFPFDDFKKMSTLPLRYAVALEFDAVKRTKSDYYKKTFSKNPLAIVRCGGAEFAKQYYAKAKDSDDEVGIWHPFAGVDPAVPQGRLLFLYNGDLGLDGSDDLSNVGRFVGVGAAEPRPGGR